MGKSCASVLSSSIQRCFSLNRYWSCYRRRKRKNRWKERLSSSHRRTAPSNRGRLIKLVNSTHTSKSCSPPEAHLRGIIIETQRRLGTREKTQLQSPHQGWKHFQRKLSKNIKTMADHLSRHPLSSETTQRSLMSTGRCGAFEHHRINKTLLLHTKSQFDLSKQSASLLFSSPAVTHVKERVFTNYTFEELNLHPHLVSTLVITLI